MAKYLFVYHGGKDPETEEEVAQVLDAWGTWFGSMGAAVVDGGNPVKAARILCTRMAASAAMAARTLRAATA